MSLRDKIKKIVKEEEFPQERISKLKQTSVTGDEEAHATAVARAMEKNIEDKFRSLGIDVDDIDVMPIEAMKKPFNLSFQLKNPVPQFFKDKKKISGKAMGGRMHKGSLYLKFKHEDGEVDIRFANKSIDSQILNSKYKGLREGGEYTVMFQKGGTFGRDDEFKPGIYKYITNSGKEILVTPLEDQSDVKEGWVLVQNIKTKKKFAAEKKRLETKGFQNKIKITSLDWKGDPSDFGGESKKIGRDNVKVRGGLKLLNKGDNDSFWNWLTLQDIDKKLKSGGLIRKSEKERGTYVLTLGKTVVILKPKMSNVEDPDNLVNWDEVEVEIGRKAMGKNEFTDTKGIIKLV